MEVAACPHTFFPAELMKKGYNFLGITTIIVPYIRDFVTFKFFFNFCFQNLCFQLPKNVS